MKRAVEEEHVDSSTSRDPGPSDTTPCPLQLELRVMGKPSKRMTFEGGTFWDLVRIFLQGNQLRTQATPSVVCARTETGNLPVDIHNARLLQRRAFTEDTCERGIRLGEVAQTERCCRLTLCVWRCGDIRVPP